MTLVALVTSLAVVTSCSRNERTVPSTDVPAVEAPTTAPADTAEYIARGNEPFWAVNVTRKEIVFLEPERQDGVRGAYVPPTREGAYLVFRTVLRDSMDIPFELRLEERPCNDSMSDHAYTHAAVVHMGDRVFEGCAERRPAMASDSARSR